MRSGGGEGRRTNEREIESVEIYVKRPRLDCVVEHVVFLLYDMNITTIISDSNRVESIYILFMLLYTIYLHEDGDIF